MPHDLVIRGGHVADGLGADPIEADVAVDRGTIVGVGAVPERGREEVDAAGLLVTPGFVDIHTHYDGQATWDARLAPSSWHGVTTVVMGNCGVGFAPVRPDAHDRLISLMEGVEDIPGSVLHEGIDWTWESFAGYLDALETKPHDIDFCAQLPHGALRLYVMGERAARLEEATEEDALVMRSLATEALRAGAIGFTTSRSPSHETPDRRPVASRVAPWDEVRRLVGVMGEMNTGIFEIAGEGVDRDPGNPGLKDYHRRLRELAVETGRPITFGVFSRKDAPDIWRNYLTLLEETAAAGGRMFGQVHSRWLSAILSFKTQLPFDRLPVWKDLRALPLAEQKQRLRDPELRRRLVEAARERDTRKALGTEARPPVYDWLFVMDTVEGPHQTVAEVAKMRGVDPVEAMIDLALEKDFELFFLQPIANENQDHALELIKHPHTVVTFSDSGAHVSQLMDASLQTHLLSHWVRTKQAFTLEQAVRMISFDTATRWGFADRGLVREGFAADLVVFDPDTIGPEMPEVVSDLPAGAKRLTQRCRGVAATVVNGEVLLRDGKHTGALPGRLLRGPLAKSA